MPQSFVNKRIHNYIVKHRLTKSGKQIAQKFGLEKSVINRYMRIHKLTPSAYVISKFKSVALTGNTTATKKEDAYIRDNYLTMPVKIIARKIGRSHGFIVKRIQRLGLKIPAHVIEHRKQESRFKKGMVSFNKGKKQQEYMSKAAIARTKNTRFKKGNLPHNSIGVKDGDITIRKHLRENRSYKYIRLSLGKWYPLHQYKWEKKNGRLPKGYCLWFKDGNTMNCTLKNLELITRAQNMQRNTIHRFPVELKSTIRLVNKLKRTIHAKEQN